MRRTALGFVAVSLVVMTVWALGAAGQVSQEGEKPPAPGKGMPGITAEDPFPGGCVDCHLDMPERDMDVRISTLMKGWMEKVDPRLLAIAQRCVPEGVVLKGVHPEVEDDLGDIPASCIRCHRKMAKEAPVMGSMLHLIHLTGGDTNEYLAHFQGGCTHCHKLDTQTGNWRMPSGPEK